MAKTEYEKCLDYIIENHLYTREIVQPYYRSSVIDEYKKKIDKEVDDKHWYSKIEKYVLEHFDGVILWFHLQGCGQSFISSYVPRQSQSIANRLHACKAIPNKGGTKECKQHQKDVKDYIESILPKYGEVNEFIEKLVTQLPSPHDKQLTISNSEQEILTVITQQLSKTN